MTFEYTIVALLALASIGGVLYWYGFSGRKTDAVMFRMKQAAKLKWKKVAEIKSDDHTPAWTQRSVVFARGKEEAVLWYKDATVTLVRDYAPSTFDDFIELEEWLIKNPRDSEVDAATGERLYLRQIERFVIRNGHFSSLLEATATDKSFFNAVYALQKTGYAVEEDPIVVAALMLEGLMRYQKSREAGLRFLIGLAKDIASKPAAT